MTSHTSDHNAIETRTQFERRGNHNYHLQVPLKIAQ